MKILGLVLLLLSSTNAMALKNGKYFTAEEFPEVVKIKQFGNKSCSATKISSQLYLTAAHCIKILDLSERSKQRLFITQSLTQFDSNIEEIYFHPTVDLKSFGDGDNPNLRLGEVVGHIFGKKVIDLAIIKIKIELPEIKAMPLFNGELQKGQVIKLAAYGGVGNNYGGYPRWGYQKIRKTGDVFTKVKHSKEYPAEVMPGDSGSPLIVTVDNDHYLAGVATWKKPGIFGGAGYYISPKYINSWTKDVIDNVMIPNLVY